MPEMVSETVVEFGPPESEPRRGRAAGFLRELGTDRRLAPLVAVLGGIAAFASLVSEWQVTSVDSLLLSGDDVGASKMLPTDLFDLGGIAAAYLGGLFLVVVALVLTIFGPAPGRRYARLAGLASGGVLAALLLALVHLLNDQSRLISRFYTIQLEAGHMDVRYGRGLWCALAGVGAALIALWLSGRDDEASEAPRWQRTAPVDTDDDAPLELSIAPTAPFASYAADLDRPHQSG
ncbi:hypothetical protein [Actinoplanes palleronii]|nr:hypothetical protein [Actinoplanes palleronii]